jgi:hypothetical protein
VEQYGIRAISLNDFLVLCQKTTVDAESFRNFKSYWAARGELQQNDGIRNPSAIWAAQLFLGWLIEKIKSEDTYVCGPLRNTLSR